MISKSVARSSSPKKSSGTIFSAAVVAPGVGVADLVANGVQLGESLLLGFRAHPIQLLDSKRHGVFDCVGHFERGGFRLRREGRANVSLAKRFAEIRVDVAHATLPSRLNLFAPRRYLAIEVEVFVDEGGGKFGGVRVDDVEAEIGFPVVERRGLECALRPVKKSGSADVDRGEGR